MKFVESYEIIESSRDFHEIFTKPCNMWRFLRFHVRFCQQTKIPNIMEDIVMEVIVIKLSESLRNIHLTFSIILEGTKVHHRRFSEDFRGGPCFLQSGAGKPFENSFPAFFQALPFSKLFRYGKFITHHSHSIVRRNLTATSRSAC